MTNILDFNDAQEQRDIGSIIPDGTFVKLKGMIRRGGYTHAGMPEADNGLFKQANPPSDSIMLDWEFTVMEGEHAKRKLWQYFVIFGGSVDEKGQSKAGNISKSTLRAMLDSALGLDPKDMSEAAKARRMMPTMTAFDGIEFAARLAIEAGGPKNDGTFYNDKNRIGHVVVPGEPEWLPVMQGQSVPARPTGSASRPAAAPAAQAKPAWQQSSAPASAPAAASTATPAWGNNGSGAAPTAAPGTAPAGTAGGPAWLRG